MSTRHPTKPRQPQHAPSKSQPTLAEFMRNKAKAACPVCQLPKEIRDQLGSSAAKKGFTRPDQHEWLRSACGASHITFEELNSHLNGKHDQETGHG